MKTISKTFKIGTKFQMGSSEQLHEVWGLGILQGFTTVFILRDGVPQGYYFESELLDWIKTGFVKIVNS